MRCGLLTRSSNVSPDHLSLSVECRLGETVAFLEENKGWSLCYINPHNEVARSQVDWCDVLMLNKDMTQEALDLCCYAQQKSKVILYDIDDFIFDYPDYSAANKGTLTKTNIIDPTNFLEIASIITVSNPLLQKHVSTLGYSALLLSNGIWMERYRKKEVHSKIPTSSCNMLLTNADKLKLKKGRGGFLRALTQALSKNESCNLTYIGDYPNEVNHLELEASFSRMPYRGFMNHICNADYDMALVPLGAHEDKDSFKFNSMKSPFKFLNYGCAGIPGIYSENPIYSDLIEDRATGLITPNTQQDWQNAITELTSDENLRARIVKNSFDAVTSNFHISRPAGELSRYL